MNLWQRLNAFDRRLSNVVCTWKGVGVMLVVWCLLAMWFGYLEGLADPV